MPASVIDTATIRLAISVRPVGGVFPDYSTTPLRLTLTPINGGTPLATADTASGTLIFVAASGGTAPVLRVELPLGTRAWRVSTPTAVLADILRQFDPTRPAEWEWLGRARFVIHPGSDSLGIARPASTPVLLPITP